MSEERIERIVWFSGLVQGVGFRYETLKIAKGYEITGFVRNLTDGRVYLLCQGVPSEVTDFITAVSDTLSDYIREKHEESGPHRESYRSFEIKR